MRSKFETNVGKYLDKEGVPYEYEKDSLEYKMPLRKNKTYCADCGSSSIISFRSYTPDFFLRNGVIIEAKGRWTADGRRIAKEFPNVKLLFMRDNTLSKSSKTKYSDFCKKNGLDYHISYKGHIPERWINEKGK